MMPAFSPAISFDGVAEELLVVERDLGDHRDQRIGDDVGGVVAAAEAHLEQQVVRRVIGEELEGGGGGDLELRDRRAGIGVLDRDQHLDQLVLVDETAAARRADAHALVEAHEMGRGVDVHRLAGRLQHGAQEGGGGALAVGAGDVDDRRQAQVGTAELVHQDRHAVQRQVDLARIERAESLKNGGGAVHAGERIRCQAVAG